MKEVTDSAMQQKFNAGRMIHQRQILFHISSNDIFGRFKSTVFQFNNI
jgi:hypothetical protein